MQNSDLSDVTVGVKAFLREQELQKTLESAGRCGFSRVIVADDSEITPEKDRIYRNAGESADLTLLRLPFDSGLSAGRNEIVRHCNTPYLLMLDDDQLVPKNIARLRNHLIENPALGGVSGIWDEWGKIKCTACNIFDTGSYFIKDCGIRRYNRLPNNPDVYVYDFIPNSTMFRLEALTESKWDSAIKIGYEHLDFYVSQKKLGKWKFAVDESVVISHIPGDATGPSAYNSYRRDRSRLTYYRELFEEKWHRKKIEGRKHIEQRGDLAEHLVHTLVCAWQAASGK